MSYEAYKPSIHPSVYTVTSRANAKPWLPELTRKLIERDLAQWNFQFGFKMPLVEGNPGQMVTLWVVPIWFPNYALDHQDNQSGIGEDINFFGDRKYPMMNITFEARISKTANTPTGGAGFVACFLEPSGEDVHYPLDNVANKKIIYSTSWQDVVMQHPVQKYDGEVFIPTGLWYLHIAAAGNTGYDFDGKIWATYPRVRRAGPAYKENTCRFWIKVGD